jgi:hypothetical protein
MVTINEKEYPVLAKYSAIKLFCDKRGLDFFEFPDLLMNYGIGKKDFKPTSALIDDMALLMWCFLQRGSEVNKTTLDLSVSDVLDWFMEGNVAVVYELITEAQGASKNVKATEENQS